MPWTTAKLCTEALKHRLHVEEDPALILLLGHSKFVDMVVFGDVGWQHGVSHLFALFVYQNSGLTLFPCSNQHVGVYNYLPDIAAVRHLYGPWFLLITLA